MTQENSEKEIPSAPTSGVEPNTFRLLVRMLYSVPLSYRRLVGAKAIKPMVEHPNS